MVFRLTSRLRDVNRFLSTLAFHTSLFRAGQSFDVNPVDLIGLEVLRVFHPEVYRAIAVNKQLLTGRPHRDQRRNEGLRHAVVGIINQAREKKLRPHVREIVKQLFSTIEWALDGSGYGEEFDETWYRELRVCSEEWCLKLLFPLAIADDDISQATMDRILDATGDRSRLRAEFLGQKARGLLEVALDRLEAYKESIPLDHAEGFLAALCDVCDDLLHTTSGMFEIAPMMHAVRIIYWYLKREPDATRRLNVLEAAIRQTEGLSLPVDPHSWRPGSWEKRIGVSILWSMKRDWLG